MTVQIQPRKVEVLIEYSDEFDEQPEKCPDHYLCIYYDAGLCLCSQKNFRPLCPVWNRRHRMK